MSSKGVDEVDLLMPSRYSLTRTQSDLPVCSMYWFPHALHVVRYTTPETMQSPFLSKGHITQLGVRPGGSLRRFWMSWAFRFRGYCATHIIGRAQNRSLREHRGKEFNNAFIIKTKKEIEHSQFANLMIFVQPSKTNHANLQKDRNRMSSISIVSAADLLHKLS